MRQKKIECKFDRVGCHTYHQSQFGRDRLPAPDVTVAWQIDVVQIDLPASSATESVSLKCAWGKKANRSKRSGTRDECL